jgi:antitoxin (DNA-binding transcriptional repressor) of toxin-antitoxin stability system
MSTLTLAEVQATLPELVHRLAAGEEIVITERDAPVATLIGRKPKEIHGGRPGAGLCRGMVTYMAPDFDEALEDMQEYME